MATLSDTLRSFLTPELLSKASTALGESQGNVSRGLGAALFDACNARGDRILAFGRRFTDSQREIAQRLRAWRQRRG